MNQSNRFCRRAAKGRSQTMRAFIEPLQRRVFLDAVPLTVTDAAFIFDAFPTRQTITLTFSANVGQSLQEQDITLQNLTTASIVQENVFGISFDESTNVASIKFDGSLPFHALPDGNYRLTLPAGSVQDAAGNVLETTFTFDFFVLAGDANRDRRVDTVDFNILAANFAQSERTFSQGDFNYDGKVDTVDFNILASRFATELAPPAALNQPTHNTFDDSARHEADPLA